MLVHYKVPTPTRKKYGCDFCDCSYGEKMHLGNNMIQKKPQKKIVKKSVYRDQRVKASQGARTRIHKSKWSALIKSYEEALLNGDTIQAWGEIHKVKNPQQTYSRWCAILKKDSERK